ncbi:protein of unknown function DUF928 [Thalassoporum mexicanum PCC 7367]|uniref:DUF928 domain-containing protein n=1 Tax=Thalassoporum mexicanum TaxID=3457544 RepID=UPI00029FEE01|nr:DUF928 domain-containing protein [Pseudanabaena sp. PCC 7367]AFY71375.1 protein of unknown function DUF928 [Pseudanabaena sp. PCC 7367]
MAFLKHPGFKLALATLAVSLVNLSTASLFSVAQAQKIRYQPPKNIGAPRSTSGGITRDLECVKSGIASCLLAVVPADARSLDHVPLTIADRPTILFHLPQSEEARIVFKMFEETADGEESVYYKAFWVDNPKSGIISFQLPEDAPELELDKNYRWWISISALDVPPGQKLEGYIRRIEPTAELSQLNSVADSLEKAATLAQAGVWYDAVATLANLHFADSASAIYTTEWTGLLNSIEYDGVSLVKIAEQPKTEYDVADE